MVAAARKVEKTDNLPPPLVSAEQLVADFKHLVDEVDAIEAECADLPNVAEDEEDLALITAAATKIIKQTKVNEEKRKDEKRPYLDAEEVLDDFFKHGLNARLQVIKSGLEQVSTAYQKKKAQREQAARDKAAAEAAARAEAAQKTVVQAVQSGDVGATTAAVTQANSLTAFANRAMAAAAAPTSSMATVKTDTGSASLVDNWTFEDVDMNTIDLEALRPFLAQASVEQALRAFIKSGRRQIRGAVIFNDSKSRFRG
jgi:hypothetical protein